MSRATRETCENRPMEANRPTLASDAIHRRRIFSGFKFLLALALLAIIVLYLVFFWTKRDAIASLPFLKRQAKINPVFLLKVRLSMCGLGRRLRLSRLWPSRRKRPNTRVTPSVWLITKSTRLSLQLSVKPLQNPIRSLALRSLSHAKSSTSSRSSKRTKPPSFNLIGNSHLWGKGIFYDSPHQQRELVTDSIRQAVGSHFRSAAPTSRLGNKMPL